MHSHFKLSLIAFGLFLLFGAQTIAQPSACGGNSEAYQIWDFGLDDGSWALCTGLSDQGESSLGKVETEVLLKTLGFPAAIEANRRGLKLMLADGDKAQRTYKKLTQASTLFEFASSRGLAEAYSNLALTEFALTNLAKSLEAAKMGALLNQPEAMGLLAYFKIESIHTEQDLSGAFDLINQGEALGADLNTVKNLDISYQFFKSHWSELQKALAREGLFNGEANGIFGDDAKISLTLYQLSKGFEVTQKINLHLLDSLGMLKDFNQFVEAQQYVYGTY